MEQHERTQADIVGKHFVRCQYAGIQIPAGIGHATGSNYRHAGDFRL